MSLSAPRLAALAALAGLALIPLACDEEWTDSASAPQEEAARPMVLHLDQVLQDADFTGCEPREPEHQTMAWDFPDDISKWRSLAGRAGRSDEDGPAPRVETLKDGVRLHWEGESGETVGYYVVDLPELSTEDWTSVSVVLRSQNLDRVGLGLNLRERGGSVGPASSADQAELIGDGEVHTYQLSTRPGRWRGGGLRGPWNELVLAFLGERPARVDLLAVRLNPKAARYDQPVQTCKVMRGNAQREAIAFHAPGAMEFPVRVPEGGRLDAAVGTLSADEEVHFRVRVLDESGAAKSLWDRRLANAESWTALSVDLSAYAGQNVRLSLEGEAENAGSVAFWAAPTVSGQDGGRPPNVILYVIDGAGADLMSVYGYHRETTPNLARLADEGTLFEYCHTNSGWTKSSTASFMSSLHHSILGGYSSDSDQIPDKVVLMSEHFRNAGYQTAVFTSNPFAGSLSGLQRGVDVFRDAHAHHNSSSSKELADEFWEWRDAWPGQPYWVHFQVTDVHEPHDPSEGFAGRFVTEEELRWFHETSRRMRGRWRMGADTVLGGHKERLERIGVDPKEYFRVQNGLYDETMAHADHQIGELVAELKERGEWNDTLLIVASDHGHPAGSFSRFGRGQLEPAPEDWEGALADSYRTRIPLMMFWPGHVPADRRIDERVSMIDLLPTVLEYAGLEQPPILQGRSLIPLIDGAEGWETRPIILDQFQADDQTGEMAGHFEMIDGKWAASLEVVPDSFEEAYRAGERRLSTRGGWRAARPHRSDTPPLLLYDLEADPFCTKNRNADHPELVEEYTRRLEELWEAQTVLAAQFAGAGAAEMTPEQLEALKVLGYIR